MTSKESVAYEWNTTVCAHIDLRLVGIDEDSWVAQWATATITLNNTFMCPSNWLFVNQGDSSVGFGLE